MSTAEMPVFVESRAYYANWGPLNGPVLELPNPKTLVLFDTPGDFDAPVGLAHPDGSVKRSGAQVQAYRLGVGAGKLDGLWICDARRFVRIDV